jgi:hypothetical protein
MESIMLLYKLKINIFLSLCVPCCLSQCRISSERMNPLTYEVLSESSRIVIVVTASVKEDEGEAKVTLLQAYCISLPHETAL